jgi:hypothetical protein
MSAVLWLVGEPGVGKTTIARPLLGSYGAQTDVWRRPKFTVFGQIACAAGHWTGAPFDGADTVPVGDIKPAVGAWADLLAGKVRLTVFDGDKFSTASTVERVRARLPEARLVCAHFVATPDLAAERRLLRGSKQNEAWLKGRRTKSARFAEAFPGVVLTLDASKAPSALIEEIRTALA